MRLVIIVLASLTAISLPTFAQAETAPPPNPQDLTSTIRFIQPGDLVKSAPLTILEGTDSRTITADTLLTPAEKVAAQQVSQSGRQSLKLSPQGNAIGGSFIIGPDFSDEKGNWIIPPTVSSFKQTPAPGRFTLPAEGLKDPSTIITDTTHRTIIKHLPMVRISTDEEQLVNLESGEAMVAATKQTTVRAGSSTITIHPGAAALIWRNGESLSVRPLFEDSSNSVRVQVGQRFAELSAGQELLLAPTFREVSRLLRADTVARRRIRNFEIPNAASYMRSEIQLTSLVQNSNLLSAIMSSKRPGDKSIATKIIKMAACIAHTKGKHGSYAPMR